MPLSSMVYTVGVNATVGQVAFDLAFEGATANPPGYLDQAHIWLYLNGALVPDSEAGGTGVDGFTFITDTRVQLKTYSPILNDVVEFRRIVPKDRPYINFVDRAGITEYQLDSSNLANLYSIHEIMDGFGTGIYDYYTLARQWAENPEDDPVVAGGYSALHWAAKAAYYSGSMDAKVVLATGYADDANDSAVAAAASALAASGSATSASSSATAADNSKIAAAASAAAALVSENAASVSATDAGEAAVAALVSEGNASASAIAAASSELSATGSASAASASEIAAASSELVCDAYVQAAEDALSGVIGVRKNHIINGNFDIWQEGLSQTSNGYGSDDMWANVDYGIPKVHSRQSFTIGQTDVPGNPKYYSRTVVTSVAGQYYFCGKLQRVEDVTKLSGKTVTLSFYAKVDSPKNIAIEFIQHFGTGGTPSTAVESIGTTTFALTTAWQKFTVTVTLPSVSGKILGTDANNHLEARLWFDAGSSFNSRTNSLGQQSGTFDIAQVQLEEGSVATNFEFRPPAIEELLCRRYYRTGKSAYRGDVTVSSAYMLYIPLGDGMRTAPTITSNIVNSYGFDTNSPAMSSISTTEFRAVKTCTTSAPGGFFEFTWAADARL